MSYPKVSIIILNWNGLEDTIECLESLEKVTYPNFKVVVVDNGSKGDDVQVLKEKFGHYIHLVCNDKNYGFAGGSNIGIRYALDKLNPGYLLLLNNDTVVDPGFLTQMIKVAEADLTIGIAGVKVYSYDSAQWLQSVWGKINFWKGHAEVIPSVISGRIRSREIDQGQYDQIKEVDWVTGCCFLLKKDAIEKVGLFDEGYFSFWEELDYCLRAKKAGYKTVFIPKGKVWHKLLRSAEKVPGLAEYYSVRNRFRFMRKHATRWQYGSFLLYFFGLRFWLATGYYLLYEQSPKALLGYYRGAKDGLLNSRTSARFYSGDS